MRPRTPEPEPEPDSTTESGDPRDERGLSAEIADAPDNAALRLLPDDRLQQGSATQTHDATGPSSLVNEASSMTPSPSPSRLSSSAPPLRSQESPARPPTRVDATRTVSAAGRIPVVAAAPERARDMDGPPATAADTATATNPAPAPTPASTTSNLRLLPQARPPARTTPSERPPAPSQTPTFDANDPALERALIELLRETARRHGIDV